MPSPTRRPAVSTARHVYSSAVPPVLDTAVIFNTRNCPQQAHPPPPFYLTSSPSASSNAWCISTFFQPDEFFQALEPAWRLAFGPNSRPWLTWEWHRQLRSSLHPALFSLAYLLADKLSCWLPAGHALRTAVVMAAPKVLQALLAALGDWYAWQLAADVYGPDVDHAMFARASLCLAALAVVLRPTNVLIWATVVGLTLTRASLRGPSPLTRSCVVALFRDAALCGGLVVALSLVSDRLYFGFWTFPPLNWLNFNISKSLAVFYGRNPWHYYLLQGIPLLCTTSLPFVLWAMNVLAAPRAAAFFTSSPPSLSSKPARLRSRLRNKPLLLAALAVNLCLAGYLAFFHQAAPLAVLSHLRGQYERIHAVSPARLAHATSQAPDELFALFLTPCHSTPWRSHLVYPGLDAYALSCEPPLHTEPGTPERAAYRDEADRFYEDPLRFLRTELFRPGGLRAPRYIIGFEGIEPWLRRFLETDEAAALGLRHLDKVWAGFNGLFSDDWRRAGKLLVWDTGVYDNVAQLPNMAEA
ncbi:hypothetical protein G6O67_003970 [Ophiocordyceps sinensis]|uniref:Mannosyltransferase n=1 Tax=Ophiocordyceps sinensis TaxID=72228 RepID=A0A8H4LXN0_9HYPO|nr:hypothetical protein G6O67_003970 [Ophiocordyceps sinensis]